MRYDRETRRAMMNTSPVVLDQLRQDFRLIELDISEGISRDIVKRKMLARMWLGDMCEWTYWGGTKVVEVDKNTETTETDERWVSSIKNAYEYTTKKTNRRIFGRRYFRKKVIYPTSLVFYEKGDVSGGRHIHTVHHFPQGALPKVKQYLMCFTSYWNSHQVNNSVGRTFWYEPVEDQDKVIRYATERMTNNYVYCWFPAC